MADYKLDFRLNQVKLIVFINSKINNKDVKNDEYIA